MERRFWDRYMEAYEYALNETSRPWAPWYNIPADDKPFMRVAVAEIIRDTLAGLDMQYPVLAEEKRLAFEKMRPILEADDTTG